VKTKGAPRSLAAPAVPHEAVGYITLPPLEVHSPALAASVQPWPLQAFWPLQAELALLQALVPLQALAPLHLVVWAWAAVASAPAAKRAAAVATRVRLVMMGDSLKDASGDVPAAAGVPACRSTAARPGTITRPVSRFGENEEGATRRPHWTADLQVRS
jgi:hypothetical protein